LFLYFLVFIKCFFVEDFIYFIEYEISINYLKKFFYISFSHGLTSTVFFLAFYKFNFPFPLTNGLILPDGLLSLFTWSLFSFNSAVGHLKIFEFFGTHPFINFLAGTIFYPNLIAELVQFTLHLASLTAYFAAFTINGRLLIIGRTWGLISLITLLILGLILLRSLSLYSTTSNLLGLLDSVEVEFSYLKTKLFEEALKLYYWVYTYLNSRFVVPIY